MSGTFSAAQLDALAQLADLWREGPTFVLVGAAAIHCHRASPRRTNDLDIVVALPLEALPAGLDALPGWSRNPQQLHEWRGPGQVLVDLLPAGASLVAQGYVELSPGARMNLVGFEHVFTRCKPISLRNQLKIEVAPLEVLALLKIVAYQDRPMARLHDLQDLAFLLDEYITVDDMRRWDDEILDSQLPFQDVSAYLLGRDMADFMTRRDREQVDAFLSRLHDSSDATCSRLAAYGPSSWARDEDVVLTRFGSLERGLARR